MAFSAACLLFMYVNLLSFTNANAGLSDFINTTYGVAIIPGEGKTKYFTNTKLDGSIPIRTNLTDRVNEGMDQESQMQESNGYFQNMTFTVEDVILVNNLSSPNPHTTELAISSVLFTSTASPSLTPSTMTTECTIAQLKDGSDCFLNVSKHSTTSATSLLNEVTACAIKIEVQEGNSIDAFFESLVTSATCVLHVSFCQSKGGIKCIAREIVDASTQDESWSQNYYHFKQDTLFVDVSAHMCPFFDMQLHYRGVPSNAYNALPVYNTSSTSGYVTTPGYDDNKHYPAKMNATFQLNITQEEVVLLSFPHFDLENHTICRYDSLKLYIASQPSAVPVRTWCGLRDIPTRLYNTSIRLQFVSDSIIQQSGFKMMFTILPKSKAPTMIAEDLFNCTVPHYDEFAHHFNCNLAVNCVGREDEMNCEYTSQECGPGLIDAGDKCYTYSPLKQGLSWFDAFSRCLSINQSLVSPQNPGEWRLFLDTMQHGKMTSIVYTGLRTSQATSAAVPGLYQSMWQWADLTIGLYIHLYITRRSLPTCTRFIPHVNSDKLLTVSCVQQTNARYMCEKWKASVNQSPGSVVTPSLSPNYTRPQNVSLVSCPFGHVVRDFLSCDLQSQCLANRYGSTCIVHGVGFTEHIPLFQCKHSAQSVHYTLVCDFRLDCSDGSDETWCVRSQCPQDSCRSGQCISSHHRCDGMQHCVDASDENCPQMVYGEAEAVPPPVLVNFDIKGQYSLHAMNNTDRCPDTHFKCADGYCLPLYVRCNGVDDCPGREDEAGCDRYTCPGYFRCRASAVCLHPDHVCDGIFHCPQQDDELLCHLTCPYNCYCQGLAFVCHIPFSASSFPLLRYLDVSDSLMTLSNLTDNFYLVHLRMCNCDLQDIPPVHLPNLQILDISYNLLTNISLDSFLFFENLKDLILSGNPLLVITPAVSLTLHKHLESLSLSGTQITTINGSIFKNFHSMKNLNMSTRSLKSITEGLGSTPDMEVLDLRGSSHMTYPVDLLKDLDSLRLLYANDFKLCCRGALPASFDLDNCHAPSDGIASCEDLLRSDLFQVFLWIFALLSVFGNVGSLVARFYLQNESFQSSFSILVTNLSVADFVMGVYLTIIGVADYTYRGKYFWHEDTWKNSVACQAAGFLSFLSSEVSAFFVCLITLDRLLVLNFPFSRLRFQKKSALVASGIAWIVGLVLAAVPVLPRKTHWDFYSQTGICIPLPFSSKNSFKGYTYSFSVMIVLNLVLFVLIAVGQVFIYTAVRASSMAQGKKKASRDSAIARRLTTIVLSDFLCWFPIGLLGVLAATGTSISMDIKVAVAIFVLPFNSALNPFLYTFGMVMEKRRKAAEARMLERLESRHFTELSRIDGRLPIQLTVTKETALNQIEGWLGVRVLTMTDLASRFDMMPKMNGIDTPSLGAVSDVL